jgi:hypothetical protein
MSFGIVLSQLREPLGVCFDLLLVGRNRLLMPAQALLSA